MPQQLFTPFLAQIVAYKLSDLGFRQGLHFQLFAQPQFTPQTQLTGGENHRCLGKIFLKPSHIPPRCFRGQLIQAIDQQQKTSLAQQRFQRLIIQHQIRVVLAQKRPNPPQNR
ncbi:MAG: hypothetical protein AAF959_24175 [Cyanobacteria bacterium P01_D01_bin.56]